ncbi:coiled-coil domain-containing protein 115 [Macrosteles quadrilineatus]|uniref:coiled-coil domain-containing protein 115 n=1 Tax=Macrosteles quadrilineatus TaxID=74068 RepID=UPI0023E1C52D|nr:coiled-coil domain-containing protein 115 [Macrosteles quadrilineatus]
MSETNLKDIENELDELSVRILELMNDNISCKMDIERTVRSGCLDMAKTRYILGNTSSVSAMKIPTEDLNPISTVISSAEDGKLSYELKREPVQKVSSEDKSKNVNQDPLKWFGVLVPTNLRQAQSWFNKALDLSVQSANITVEINASLEKYDRLSSKKSSLKNVSDES